MLKIKNIVTRHYAATCLVHPSPTADTRINTDASDTAVGAVLQQHIAGVRTPICFFSRKLHSAETKYSAFDKELLAMYLAVNKFRHFIERRQFTLFTDHKPLTFAFSSASDKCSPRQQRHIAFVSEFTTTVRHVPGVDNARPQEAVRPVRPWPYHYFSKKKKKLNKTKLNSHKLTQKHHRNTAICLDIAAVSVVVVRIIVVS